MTEIKKQQQRSLNERGTGRKRKATKEVIEWALALHTKGLSQQSIDFIAGIIRQELMAIYHIEDIRAVVAKELKGNSERLEQALRKSGKASAAGYFLLVKLLTSLSGQFTPEEFMQMAEVAGQMGAEYMKQSNLNLSDVLCDGETICRMANLQEGGDEDFFDNMQYHKLHTACAARYAGAMDSKLLDLPQQALDSFARMLLPKIQQFFGREESKRAFKQWKLQQAEPSAK